MMLKVWSDNAWDDYLYWQTQDKKTLKRINQLLKDIDRNRNEGVGKPEPLKYLKGGGIGAGVLTTRIVWCIGLLKIGLRFSNADLITMT